MCMAFKHSLSRHGSVFDGSNPLDQKACLDISLTCLVNLANSQMKVVITALSTSFLIYEKSKLSKATREKSIAFRISC